MKLFEKSVKKSELTAAVQGLKSGTFKIYKTSQTDDFLVVAYETAEELKIKEAGR